MPAIKEIRETDIHKFLRKVWKLPRRPVGKGECQLIRKQNGDVICQGKCADGKCWTDTGNDGKGFSSSAIVVEPLIAKFSSVMPGAEEIIF